MNIFKNLMGGKKWVCLSQVSTLYSLYDLVHLGTVTERNSEET